MSHNLLTKDGEAFFYPEFFTKEESDQFFETLLQEVKWKQEPIIIFGKKIMQPRLTAWYGDEDLEYSYSGITMQSHVWTKTLLEIKTRIESVAKVHFNGALLNYYRDEKDSMGWHRDNEKELGPNPIIGSVSLGATRIFKFQHVNDKELQASVNLDHGSFLLMQGSTQHYWKHSIPKKTQPLGPRINLTFRVILPLKTKN